jgi:hypothetical protein
MNDPLIPFLTVFTPDPDMSLADLQAQIIQLNQRNLAIDSMLQGHLPPADLFELLAEDGIDPDGWIEVSIENCLFYG